MKIQSRKDNILKGLPLVLVGMGFLIYVCVRLEKISEASPMMPLFGAFVGIVFIILGFCWIFKNKNNKGEKD
ncbi:MAG: hypothetical protein WC389_12830 [Lutibacter sp.]|jgi:hypothetical protein